jgi:hypothetical protein
MRWDLTFSQFVPEMKEMHSWNPSIITHLALPNMKLNSFHVGTLTSLVELDLSNNLITMLLGTGIEQCTHLVRANVSNNRITKKSNFKVFEFNPSLLYLNLEGNRDALDATRELSDYRALVIFTTRNLKGTNRCTGLIELDNNLISMEERIAAVERYGKKKKDALIFK